MTAAQGASAPSSPEAEHSAARWEMMAVAVAVCLALVLGFSNLGRPSLWHDELVHVFVAQKIIETGHPSLPSGYPYSSYPVYNYPLAGWISVFGNREAAVRTPSVLFAALNVLLTYLLLRRSLGRATAVVSALALALSPWSVAWAREARFCSLQQSSYLVFLLCFRQAVEAPNQRKSLGWAAVAGLVYLLALGISYHSILFLAPAGAYVFLVGIQQNHGRSRWVLLGIGSCTAGGAALFLAGWFAALAVLVVCGWAGLLSAFFMNRFRSRWTAATCLIALAIGSVIVGLYYGLPQEAHDAVFRAQGVSRAADHLELDRDRSDRIYYLRFFLNNLSAGYFVLALAGFGFMLAARDRRAFFTVLAFWMPVLCLSTLGYRRFRFMFFAFPFYVAAFSYAAVRLGSFCAGCKQSKARMAAAALIVALAVPVGVSTVRMLGDTLEVAAGAPVTLARRHPQWREPCRFVRERLDRGTAVLSTSYLPVLYYVGRCDGWYPSRTMIWEWIESPQPGLPELQDLWRFMEAHPSGFFLADYRRFDYVTKYLAEDIAWVKGHLTRIDEASNSDITVYAWGAAAQSTAPD